MQHPRFALRAVRKRGKSIAGLAVRRDMLRWFFRRINPAQALIVASCAWPPAEHLILPGAAALKRGCACCRRVTVAYEHARESRRGGSIVRLSGRFAI